jgi:hypothetical protein
MADSPSTIFLLGLTGSGKTHFLVALDVILDNQKDPNGLEHADLASDRTYLQPLKSAWFRGEELDRTSSLTPPPPHLLLVRHPPTGVTAEFSVPDLAGESFGAHFESRSLPKELGDGLQRAAGLIVFLHCNHKADHDILEHPSLVEDEPGTNNPTETSGETKAVESLKGDKPTESSSKDQTADQPNKDVEDWTIDRAPMQTRLVDLLQFVAKLNPLKAPLPVAVVISAWDLVDNVPVPVRPQIPNNPAKYLAKFWPFLNQYLANNESRFSYRVYGVSARGGGVSEVEINRLTAMPSQVLFDGWKTEFHRPSCRLSHGGTHLEARPQRM